MSAAVTLALALVPLAGNSALPNHSPVQARETLGGVGEVDAREAARWAAEYELTRLGGSVLLVPLAGGLEGRVSERDDRLESDLAYGAAQPRARADTRGDVPRSRSETCRSARRGLAFYRSRYVIHVQRRIGNHKRVITGRKPRNCPDARYLAGVAKTRSRAARRATEKWIARHVLHDFRVTPDSRAWLKAVEEAQRPYPGTRDWLLSCSASEGGHGRFVFNSQGSGAAGWAQFMPSTYAAFSWRMRVDLARRAFIVPASVTSIYSPLGQALTAAWALRNGLKHHWVGSGC